MHLSHGRMAQPCTPLWIKSSLRTRVAISMSASEFNKKHLDLIQLYYRARKLFYNSMGSTYSDCTNPLFLVGHLPAGGNITEPYAYAALWQQLDFICNGGLPIGLYSYAELMKVYGTTQGLTCLSTFLSSSNNNPTDICNIVGTFMVCVQEAYISYANNKPVCF